MYKAALALTVFLATTLVPLGEPAGAGGIGARIDRASSRPAAPSAARPAIVENGSDVIVFPYPGIAQAAPFNPGNVAFDPGGDAYINAYYATGDDNGYNANGIIKFSPNGVYSLLPAAHVGLEEASIIYARNSVWSTTYNGIAQVDSNGKGVRYYKLGINFNKIHNAESSLALGADGAIYGLVPITNSGGLPLGTAKLFRIAANATVTSFAVPIVPETPLVLGGDRHLYFGYLNSSSGAFGIARIEQNGSTTLFPLTNPGSGVASNFFVTWSASGYLYFTFDGGAGQYYLGRMTTGGVVTLLPIPAAFAAAGFGYQSAADHGGNLWTITIVNRARGLFQYNVYTGNVSGPYAAQNVSNGADGPFVGPDNNIWFIPFGNAATAIGLAAYVRDVQNLAPASLSLSVGQSASFAIVETHYNGPWSAQSLNPAVATVGPASSPDGRFTVNSVSHGTTQIAVKDALGNVSYETVTSK